MRHHFASVRHVGGAVLLANASVAFFLNIATMALIKHTSALTLNVSGVFKDLGLILWSVVVSGAVVTNVQYVGYAVALAGVTAYSAYKRNLAAKTPLPAPDKEPRVKRGYSESVQQSAAAEEALPLATEREAA